MFQSVPRTREALDGVDAELKEAFSDLRPEEAVALAFLHRKLSERSAAPASEITAGQAAPELA